MSFSSGTICNEMQGLRPVSLSLANLFSARVRQGIFPRRRCTFCALPRNGDAYLVDLERTTKAIKAGVLCIEHGFLLKEDAIKLMADKGIWLSIQPLLNDEDAIPFPDPVSQAKWIQVTNGTDKVYELAKRYWVKLAWGTDTLFDAALARKQGKLVTKLTKWFTPYEALKMVTYDNAQLLKLSENARSLSGETGCCRRRRAG
jgi:imidazolonepropionase-like amidohydrolase